MKVQLAAAIFATALSACSTEDATPSYRMTGARNVQPALANCVPQGELDALRELSVSGIEVVRQSSREGLTTWNTVYALEARLRNGEVVVVQYASVPFGWKLDNQETSSVVTTPSAVSREFSVGEACQMLRERLVWPIVAELRRQQEWN